MPVPALPLELHREIILQGARPVTPVKDEAVPFFQSYERELVLVPASWTLVSRSWNVRT